MCKVEEEKSPTLTCTHYGEPAVCYAIKDEGFMDFDGGGCSFTLKARDYKMPQAVALVINSSGGGISGTLDSHYYKGQGEREGTEREFIVCKKQYMRLTENPTTVDMSSTERRAY